MFSRLSLEITSLGKYMTNNSGKIIYGGTFIICGVTCMNYMLNKYDHYKSDNIELLRTSILSVSDCYCDIEFNKFLNYFNNNIIPQKLLINNTKISNDYKTINIDTGALYALFDIYYGSHIRMNNNTGGDNVNKLLEKYNGEQSLHTFMMYTRLVYIHYKLTDNEKYIKQYNHHIMTNVVTSCISIIISLIRYLY